MNLLSKPAVAIQAVWMLFPLAGGLIILADALGDAAWNGVNFVMFLYLLLPLVGSVGLIAALAGAISKRPVFAWIGGLSAFAIACVALVFLLGFLFRRDPNLPINESVEMFGIHAPLLLLYGLPIAVCSMQVLLSILKYRQLKTMR